MFVRSLACVGTTHLTSTGQTKPVRVYQLIAENTVESKVGDGDPGYAYTLTASPRCRSSTYKRRRRILSRRLSLA